jgi:hypothetical protein
MPNNVPGQIISELGQIAKDVGQQATQLPKDIAGKALESLGTTSKKPTTQTPSTSSSEAGKPAGAWEQISLEKNEKIRRSIARKALEALIGGAVARKREPSIWERLQAEQEQKKDQQQQQQAAASQSLPTSSGKRPRGDLYGSKAKKTATENKNVRQD